MRARCIVWVCLRLWAWVWTVVRERSHGMMSEPRCSRVCRCVYMRVQVCLCVQCVKSVCVCKWDVHWEWVQSIKRLSHEATTKYFQVTYSKSVCAITLGTCVFPTKNNTKHKFPEMTKTCKVGRSKVCDCCQKYNSPLREFEFVHMQNVQFCRDGRWGCWRLVRGHEQHVLQCIKHQKPNELKQIANKTKHDKTKHKKTK